MPIGGTFLAGPALSLPDLLVIRGVLGTKKTLTHAGLAGVAFGGSCDERDIEVHTRRRAEARVRHFGCDGSRPR